MIEEFFGTKFLKTKYISFDDKATICFEEQSGEDKPFRIMVSQAGVWFTGQMMKKISNMKELQDWARLMSKAWGEHERLAPKLSKTLSGH